MIDLTVAQIRALAEHVDEYDLAPSEEVSIYTTTGTTRGEVDVSVPEVPAVFIGTNGEVFS